MAIGFRVFLKRMTPPWEIVEAFRSIPAPNVADCLNRMCSLNSDIRLISSPPDDVMVGVALTVKTRPGDNLMIHKALSMAESHDIVIVSNGGDRNRALIGEIMASYALKKGIRGIVLDGPVRDIDALSKMTMPIYATGANPDGPFKEGPGEVNVPISCGGMIINPGDILLGNKDGVIVIPSQEAESILRAANEYCLFDRKKLDAAMNGKSDRSWIDKSLEAKNCQFIDDFYK